MTLGAQAPVPAPPEVSIRSTPYAPPSLTLHAETNLVETGLTIRDARGRAVGGVHEADLEVLDNHIAKPIVAFSEIRNPAFSEAVNPPAAKTAGATNPSAPAQPRYVTFFFDDFHIPNTSMPFVKQGARRFIAEGVQMGDRLAIVTASGQGDLDFTVDAKVFAERVEHLASHIRTVVPAFCGVSPIDSYIFLHNLDGNIREAAIAAAIKCVQCGPHMPPQACRSSALGVAEQAASSTWEQMRAISQDTMDGLEFAVKRLGQMNGPRVLVLTSTGFLLTPGHPPELQNFIDRALHLNIVVHAIGAQGLEARMGGAQNLLKSGLQMAAMEAMTNETGGHFFKDSNDLAGAMRAAADPEVSYTLAFNAGPPDGKLHTLDIKYKEKGGNELQFRPGYYSPDPNRGIAARARMDAAVLSKETLHEIPITIALSAGQPRDAVIPVSVRITLDAKAVQFRKSGGRRYQQLAFVTALFDAHGAFVTGEEAIMDLALTAEKLASIKQTGLTAVATLPAHAGVYQVRAVVREGVKGQLAAITRPVQILPK